MELAAGQKLDLTRATRSSRGRTRNSHQGRKTYSVPRRSMGAYRRGSGSRRIPGEPVKKRDSPFRVRQRHQAKEQGRGYDRRARRDWSSTSAGRGVGIGFGKELDFARSRSTPAEGTFDIASGDRLERVFKVNQTTGDIFGGEDFDARTSTGWLGLSEEHGVDRPGSDGDPRLATRRKKPMRASSVRGGDHRAVRISTAGTRPELKRR